MAEPFTSTWGAYHVDLAAIIQSRSSTGMIARRPPLKEACRASKELCAAAFANGNAALVLRTVRNEAIDAITAREGNALS